MLSSTPLMSSSSPHNTHSNIDLRNLLRVVDVESLRRLTPGDPELVQTIQPILENLVYGQLSEQSISLLSDKAIVHLVSTLQLSCIHMMHAQTSLQRLLDTANAATAEARASQMESESRLSSLQHELKARRRLQRETDTLLATMTGNTLSKNSNKRPTDGTVFRCLHCPKAFLSADFLEGHISRRHAQVSNAPIIDRKSGNIDEETSSLKAEITALRNELARSQSLMSDKSNAILHSHNSNSDAAALSITASSMRNDINALRMALEQQTISSEERLAERDSRIAALSAENAAIMGGLRTQLQDLEASLLSQIGGAQIGGVQVAVNTGSPKRRVVKSSAHKAPPPSASVENIPDVSTTDSARRFRHKVVILSPRTRSLVLHENGFETTPLKENADLVKTMEDTAKESKEPVMLSPRQNIKLTTQLFSSPLSSNFAPAQESQETNKNIKTEDTNSQNDLPVHKSIQETNELVISSQFSEESVIASESISKTEVPELSPLQSITETSPEEISTPITTQSLLDSLVQDTGFVDEDTAVVSDIHPSELVIKEELKGLTDLVQLESINKKIVMEEKQVPSEVIVIEKESKDSTSSIVSVESQPIKEESTTIETSNVSSSDNVSTLKSTQVPLPIIQSVLETSTQVSSLVEKGHVETISGNFHSSVPEEGEIPIPSEDDLEEEDITMTQEKTSKTNDVEPPVALLVTPSSSLRDSSDRVSDVRRAIEISMRTVFGSLLLPSKSSSLLLNLPKRDSKIYTPRQRTSSNTTPLVIPTPGTEIKRDYSNLAAPSLDESFQTASTNQPPEVGVLNSAEIVSAQEERVLSRRSGSFTTKSVINEADKLQAEAVASLYRSGGLQPNSAVESAISTVEVNKHEVESHLSDDVNTDEDILLTEPFITISSENRNVEENSSIACEPTLNDDQSLTQSKDKIEESNQSVAQLIESADDIIEEELKANEKVVEPVEADATNESSFDFDDDDEIESSYAKIVAQEKKKKGTVHEDDADLEIEDL
jgi:hypothetical protein